MPITINNVTANNQISIINDADINSSNPNDGPAKYSGNTEADVVIDGRAYLNISSSDIIPSNVHALQFSPVTDSGELEYVGNAHNLVLSSSADIPSWANTMITRWNGEKTYEDTYNSVLSDLVANLDATSETYAADYESAESNASAQATTAKNNILSA
jgi:hypothetical protein